MSYLERAEELQEELVKNRRELHQNPECGFELQTTVAFVKKKLTEYGYEPKDCGRAGVTCTAGKPGKTILLRADMDALPIEEKSGLSFAAGNGACHACGHDNHTAMLLGAAKMLKEREDSLNGTVKFMFQPAEENICGAEDMIHAGILKNPDVDAAIGLHVQVGMDMTHTGKVFIKPGYMSTAGDSVNIIVHGKTAHGSIPHMGIDAIQIAMHIGLAVMELSAKEIEPGKKVIILIGKIQGGRVNNSVAEECEMALSLRYESKEIRTVVLKRIREIAEGIATALGGSAEFVHNFYAPAVYNEETLTAQVKDFFTELLPEGDVCEGFPIRGGEDFSRITEEVPSVFFLLGAGTPEDGCTGMLHDPDVIFQEEMLPVGAACLSHVAERWLEENR